MKRRIAKKLESRKFLSHRNICKYIYLAIRLQGYWSVSINNKCYMMTKDGRIMIYSEVLPDGKRLKGAAYYLWNEEEKPSYPEYFTD